MHIVLEKLRKKYFCCVKNLSRLSSLVVVDFFQYGQKSDGVLLKLKSLKRQ